MGEYNQEKISCYKKDGFWKETNVAEIKQFIALIMYMGIVKLPRHDRYWSTKSLFHGLWAISILSGNRFETIKLSVFNGKITKWSPW
jgi:hypothetical protein